MSSLERYRTVRNRLLCLYTFYGDPVECKLAIIRGERAYSAFRAKVLPFVFNLLPAEDSEPGILDQIVRQFFEYIVQIQVEYHHALLKLGVSREATFPEFDNNGVSPGVIIERHHRLCEMDGTEPQDAMLRQLMIRAGQDSLWNVESATTEHLRRAIEESRLAFKQLDTFYEICGGRIKIFHSPIQTMAEFMQFLTHFSRGYRFHLLGKSDESQKDLDASTNHLKRVTLDMRKSIATTIIKNAHKKMPVPLIQGILRSRCEETNACVENAVKFELYKKEVAALLKLDLI